MSSNLPITKTGAVSADLVVSSFPTSDEVGQALRSGVRLVIDGTDDGGAGRSLSALSATTIDDVFGSELTKAGEVLGTPLTLRTFEGLRSSDYDDSILGVWAIFSATTPDGEIVTIGTGATDAVVKLVRLSELGAFDGKTTVAFEESRKATAAGFHPVNLVRVKTEEAF
jgi:hypothetical protein